MMEVEEDVTSSASYLTADERVGVDDTCCQSGYVAVSHGGEVGHDVSQGDEDVVAGHSRGRPGEFLGGSRKVRS